MALTNEEKSEMMKKAFALYFDLSVEDVGNYIFGCETMQNGAVVFSGGWVPISHWYLIGLAKELQTMFERMRGTAEIFTDPEEEAENNLDEMLRGQ